MSEFSEFHFTPPDLCDIMIFSEAIDVCTSSGIFGLNMKLCKTIIQHIPEKFRLLFSNSVFWYFPLRVGYLQCQTPA